MILGIIIYSANKAQPPSPMFGWVQLAFDSVGITGTQKKGLHESTLFFCLIVSSSLARDRLVHGRVYNAEVPHQP